MKHLCTIPVAIELEAGGTDGSLLNRLLKIIMSAAIEPSKLTFNLGVFSLGRFESDIEIASILDVSHKYLQSFILLDFSALAGSTDSETLLPDAQFVVLSLFFGSLNLCQV